MAEYFRKSRMEGMKMQFKEMFLTLLGSFAFTMIVIMFWGKMVDKIGVIGGFIAAMIIPGTMWMVNHAMEKHLIIQSGSVWIDMAMAVGTGVFISSVIQGGKIKKAKNTLSAAVCAALIGGFVLTTI